MTGVAVKVTDWPGQIVVAEADTDTDGVTGVIAVIVKVLLLTVAGVAQCVELVIWQLTCCPLVRLLVLKVELVAPVTAVPFIYH